jgi:hypothetical protein
MGKYRKIDNINKKCKFYITLAKNTFTFYFFHDDTIEKLLFRLLLTL